MPRRREDWRACGRATRITFEGAGGGGRGGAAFGGGPGGGAFGGGFGEGASREAFEEGFGGGLAVGDGDIAGDDEDCAVDVVSAGVEFFHIIEGEGGHGFGSGEAAERGAAVDGL